jgi:hypothetical protein
MTKLSLPEDRRCSHIPRLLICLGLTTIPALVLTVMFRPLSQHHIGLILASIVSGGFLHWTSSNLLTATYTSRQGVYQRANAPFRYWIHTVFISILTTISIYYLIHQALLVSSHRWTTLENKAHHRITDQLRASRFMKISTSTQTLSALSGQWSVCFTFS